MQEIHPNIGGGGGSRLFGDRRLRPHSHHHHHQQALKCPRCESLNTKFCYYNNYNLSQPRHFCKNCRRYWTKGGVLRNVPVGGGCRKSKRSLSSKQPKHATTAAAIKCVPSGKTTNSSSATDDSNNTTTAAASNNNNTAGSSSVVFQDNPTRDIFFSTEMCGFMSLMENSTDPYDNTALTTQFMQGEAAVHDWDGGGHQEQNKMQGLVGGIIDQTIRIDDLLQNRGSNGGLPTLDWQQAVQSNCHQGLFDLDHQASYWSQTTTSHQSHHHWSDNNSSIDINDHSLFLP